MMKYNKLVSNLSSEKYHSTPNSVSSTQLKTILEDPKLFYDKYVAKTIDREEFDAFGVGTYFHTAILEPHLVEKEIITYTLGHRTGANWEAFKKKHKGKAILTPAMKASGDKLIKAVKGSKKVKKYLKDIKPEVSLFVDINVIDGVIYAPFFKKRMGMGGWTSCQSIPKSKDKVKIVVKVRADALGKRFVSDLKSTSGNVFSSAEMAEKISHYDYDLSAALYLDLFSLVKPKVKEFVWLFASKDKGGAHPWPASTNNILVGRAKWIEAVLAYAHFTNNEWKMDLVKPLEPEPHQLAWIQKGQLLYGY